MPKGADVYFENVGVPVFDAVLPLFNTFARIPVCGLIAQYNMTELPPGPDRLPLLMRNVLTKRLTIRGFIVYDFAARHGDFLRDVAAWIKEGRIKYAKISPRGWRTRLRPSWACSRARISENNLFGSRSRS